MDNKSNEPQIFQFVPIRSFVHASFWHKLAENKLNIDRLSEAPKHIYGTYTNSNSIDCLLDVDFTAFNRSLENKPCNFVAHGTIYNTNTIESFKRYDKIALLNQEGGEIFKTIQNGSFLNDTTLLARFLLLSFADLKKHHYIYWFAFPSISETIAHSIGNGYEKITNIFTKNELKEFNDIYFNTISHPNNSYFLLKKSSNGLMTFLKLSEQISVTNKMDNFLNENLLDIYFCFADPSNFENAGWFLRLYLFSLLYLCPNLKGKTINILSIRCKDSISVENSLLYKVKLTNDEIGDKDLKWIGWEKNDNQKLLPKFADMAASMDPERLATTSINLNLKLMKWRFLPTLNLETISSSKCLLMGAGTLGCSVARNLLSWGVTHITFIDYGKVSYSNPVRQSLYLYEDSINGGKDKAITAAKRLNDICPGLVTNGYNMLIPMPGHKIDNCSMKKTKENIHEIEKLVKEHDVIFLLTDSRESRWLPTLLGAHFDKIVINAALGFDSYLVMRHGSHRSDSPNYIHPPQINGLKSIRGNKLGCYFCNDITAPGNSMSERTLDQQCTVTRPGVSNIAGSLAVELLVSLLQHTDRELAPAYIHDQTNSYVGEKCSLPEDILGILPHSIRGRLCYYDQILPATERFSQCIACSTFILEEYEAHGVDFLFKVFESQKHLEDLTGITEMMKKDLEIIDFSDAEELLDSD